jgi:hypothetical protein
MRQRFVNHQFREASPRTKKTASGITLLVSFWGLHKAATS